VRAAVNALEELGGVEEGESTIRLAHAEALHACGDEAGARQAIGRARGRLVARAAKVTDPAQRERFLAIPENARTLEWAREWGVEPSG
jgi:hypothetical protein